MVIEILVIKWMVRLIMFKFDILLNENGNFLFI